MSTTTAVSAEQHKFHIPPRKLLLTRRAQEEYSASDADNMTDNYSPRFSSADEALLRKFLPYNNTEADGDDDDDQDSDEPYSSDHFRMFEFKVRRCTRSRSHDWTDCPFAHPGEKARRRDPRRHHYSGTVCADYRRGSCGRGDSCEFAHGVFECWLHPARYRTEACKDGKNCKRKVCFFAHTPRQLRVLPVQSSQDDPHHHRHHPITNNNNNNNKYQVAQLNKHKPCCFFCHSASSPTSTLQLGNLSSPPMSPPLSPANNQQHCASANGGRFHSSNSPLSRYTTSASANNCRRSQQLLSAAGSGCLDHDDEMMMMMMSYKDVLAELMTSLEAMKFNTNNICELANYSSSSSSVLPIGSPRANAQRWLDVSSIINTNIHQDQDLLDQQQLFTAGGGPGNYFSPSSTTTTGHGEEDHEYYYCSPRKTGAINSNYIHITIPPDDDHKQLINHQVTYNYGPTDPDLDWVNDLLM